MSFYPIKSLFGLIFFLGGGYIPISPRRYAPALKVTLTLRFDASRKTPLFILAHMSFTYLLTYLLTYCGVAYSSCMLTRRLISFFHLSSFAMILHRRGRM